jgi:ABC-type nitrate/sulfonate/bicarbonate transport system substrate-binding protein
MSEDRLRIGFIPLIDAAALIVAVDKGFAAQEGLSIDLVREVSWSNVRDKLNIGLFDAAHLPGAGGGRTTTRPMALIYDRAANQYSVSWAPRRRPF